MTLLVLVVVIAMSVACDRGAEREARRRALGESLRRTVEATAIELPFASRDDARELAELRRRFYEARGFTPAWFDEKIAAAAEKLLDSIGTAPSHGLDARRYGADPLARVVAELRETSADDAPIEALARADAALTASYLRYGADLAAGAARVEARKLGWAETKLADDFVPRMNDALGDDIDDLLADFAEQHYDYERTRNELARQRETAGNDATAGERISRLERTLERLRWLPADLGTRHVLVNVPDFRLQAVENGEARLDMRVAVGKPDWPTPTLDSAIDRIVLNPRWNVPDEIARQEVLPEVMNDPAKAAADGIVVLDPSEENPHVIQEPGPKNPLGRIQFLFPNRYSIYLHDTPAGKVFTRDDRGVSHGCVRVEKPLELGEFVLGPAGWNGTKLGGAIEAGQRQGIEVPEPVPVHIVYWTAWLDRAGAIQLRDDIYGHDGELAKLLAPER